MEKEVVVYFKLQFQKVLRTMSRPPFGLDAKRQYENPVSSIFRIILLIYIVQAHPKLFVADRK